MKREIDWAEQERRAERHEAAFIEEGIKEMLRGAIELKADRILIRKRSWEHRVLPEDCIAYEYSDGGKFTHFTIDFEIQGDLQEVGKLQLERWPRFISRLKVVANTIDYGLRRSTNSTFAIDLDDGQIATYRLTTNPNPFSDSEVVLEVIEKEQSGNTSSGTHEGESRIHSWRIFGKVMNTT